ncbi:MAG: hypothetical protein IPL34_20370 [Thiofilum sp.]|uniref:hypothetical protein n=1 Tax=Thiofilum sp. TaxID=2212733 RepID=UPI0025D39235|nr:hypothetical protein [Thiofilum sp.]MBK8455638.1 hypothetical protein [Thiofilum sp.]
MTNDKVILTIEVGEDTLPHDYLNAIENAEKIRSLYDEVFRKYLKYSLDYKYGGIEIPADVTSELAAHFWHLCQEHFELEDKPKKASLFERMKRWMSKK